MSLSITATVEIEYTDNNDIESVTVVVEGQNLSTELIESFAKHALCMEVGCGEDELEDSLYLDETTEDSMSSSVRFLPQGA